MNTTVLVDSVTRDYLAKSKEALGQPSMDAVIRYALREATPTAKELWASHRKAAERLCAEHKVTRLIAFGSRCRDDRHPGSDLDIVVETPADIGLTRYFDFRDQLSELLGVKVDMGDIPPRDSRVWRHIVEEGVALVGPAP